MKHDEAHEKKQNKAIETLLDVLIEHIGRDVPHASDTLLKLQAVRDTLVADDSEGEEPAPAQRYSTRPSGRPAS